MVLTFYPKTADGRPDENKSRPVEMAFRFGTYDAYKFLWKNARNWHDEGYEFVDVEIVAVVKPEKIKIVERFQWNETERGYRPITCGGLNGSVKL